MKPLDALGLGRRFGEALRLRFFAPTPSTESSQDPAAGRAAATPLTEAEARRLDERIANLLQDVGSRAG